MAGCDFDHSHYGKGKEIYKFALLHGEINLDREKECVQGVFWVS